METTKRPTISIKNHLNSHKNEPTSAAINGILKKGNTYKFSEYTHEHIIDGLKKVQKRVGMNNKQFSLALGYCETAFRQWCSGARFSRVSYEQVKLRAKQLKDEAIQKEQAQLKLSLQDSSPVNPKMTDEQMAEYLMKKGWRLKTLTIEEMISHLKSLGYKIQKPITTYEEI